MQPAEADAVWQAVAAEVGMRSAWETRLAAAEWLLRRDDDQSFGIGTQWLKETADAVSSRAEDENAHVAYKATESCSPAQSVDEEDDQMELIADLVAEHAACEAERRDAVSTINSQRELLHGACAKIDEKDALIQEIVAEHAGVEAERKQAVAQAELAAETARGKMLSFSTQ